MILCDTGPLVALIDGSDPHHASCVAVVSQITPPLVTTWAYFGEAMYLVQLPRIRQLMTKYSDQPMDLADATLVALAERLNTNKVFSTDQHFRVYKIRDREPFNVVP